MKVDSRCRLPHGTASFTTTQLVWPMLQWCY